MMLDRLAKSAGVNYALNATMNKVPDGLEVLAVDRTTLAVWPESEVKRLDHFKTPDLQFSMIAGPYSLSRARLRFNATRSALSRVPFFR